MLGALRFDVDDPKTAKYFRYNFCQFFGQILGKFWILYFGRQAGPSMNYTGQVVYVPNIEDPINNEVVSSGKN